MENWNKCFEPFFKTGLHESLGLETAEQRGDGETTEGERTCSIFSSVKCRGL